MKKQSICLILVIVLGFFSETQSQWIKAYNPYNGYVSCLSYLHSKLYAGSNGNLYVSVNSGRNWTSINLTEPSTTISAVVGSGNTIFAGTLGKGIYTSTNDGNSWMTTDSGLTNLNITSLATKDSIVVAGTSGGGIFRSTDIGRTWTAANIGITNDTITAIFITDSAFIAGSNRGNIFLSEDKGIHWTLIPATSPFSISCFVNNGGKIFAGLIGGGMRVSSNGGKQWVAVNSGLYCPYVTALTTGDSVVYAATKMSGVFRSTNSGELWIPIHNGLSDTTVTSLTMSDSSILAGTEMGGVFSSSDGGRSWTPKNAGLVSVNINAFLVDGKNVFAGTQGAGVRLSTDRGKSWTELNSGLTALNVVSLAIHDSTIYAATDYYWVFKSTDYGQNWSPTTRVPANSAELAMSDSVLYVTADFDGIYRTTDGGTSWEVVGLVNNFIRPIAIRDSLILAGSWVSKGVFLSTNRGKDWASLGSSYAYSIIQDVGWCGQNIVAGIDNGVFVRPMQGGTWVKKGPQAYVYCMAIKDSIIVIGTFSGVYLSTDWGEKWAKIDSGLTGPRLTGAIHAIAIVGTDLFGGDQEKNMWKRSLLEVITDVKELQPAIVGELSLRQNYPNPFNPMTTIEFAIPVRSYTTVKIFDILGKEIHTLVAQELDPGKYSFNWDAKNNSSGVFFYRLQSGSFVATKKLLFLK